MVRTACSYMQIQNSRSIWANRYPFRLVFLLFSWGKLAAEGLMEPGLHYMNRTVEIQEYSEIQVDSEIQLGSEIQECSEILECGDDLVILSPCSSPGK